ncbi:MAG: hypothetical protein HQK96_15080 [Nitrospirae bacterium]|nr:hypothetical protein [Nitrospirota bacterium]
MIRKKQYETTNDTIEEMASRAISETLSKIPSLSVLSVERNVQLLKHNEVDIVISLAIPGEDKVKKIIVAVKNNCQPRLIRNTVNQVIRYRQTYPEAYIMIMAPYISPEAADIILEDDVGYLDFSGNCYISIGPVYIEKAGKPNIFKAKRELPSLYTPKSMRILRVLLSNPIKLWQVQEVANEADVSIGQASNIFQLLTRMGYMNRLEGFPSAKRLDLLEEWSSMYSYRINDVKGYKTSKNIQETEEAIASICKEKNVDYALTGFSSASRFITITHNRSMAYVNTIGDDIGTLLNVEAAGSEANLLLLKPYDEGVFYGTRTIDGVRVVSPVQTFLDLMGHGYRNMGESAAEAMLSIIRAEWQEEKPLDTID